MNRRPDPKYDVICPIGETCLHHLKDVARGHGCGGATPHYHLGCDPCPPRPDIKCVPVCQICRVKASEINGECRSCASDH
jgi:hypothetical protein